MRFVLKNFNYHNFKVVFNESCNYYEELNKLKDYILSELEFAENLEKFQNAILTDEEFYEEARKFYDIDFNNQDFLKMSSKLLGETAGEVTLKTSTIDYHVEENNILYNQIPQWFYLDVSIACAKSVIEKLDLNYKYSASELEDLVKNKKIVILNHSIGNKPRYFYSIGMMKKVLQSKAYLLKGLELQNNRNENNYAIYGAALREKLTKERIKMQYNSLINRLQNQLKEVKKYYIHSHQTHTNIAQAYKEAATICEETEILKRERK